ncbi:hypothetical protein BH11PAT2_BH11PAT2_03840 [soil metagenome]
MPESPHMVFVQELLDNLTGIINNKSADRDNLDSALNGEPDISMLCRQVISVLSQDNQLVAMVPDRLMAVRELYEKIETAYSFVVTRDGPPTFAFPAYTALLVGELRCLMRMLAIEVEGLPPPSASPRSPGYKAFFGAVLEDISQL